MCHFDCTAFVVSWKVGIPETGLTTPVGWLSLLKLTVISRSVIRCVIEVFVCVLCCHIAFLDFSVVVGAFVIQLRKIFSFFSSYWWIDDYVLHVVFEVEILKVNRRIQGWSKFKCRTFWREYICNTCFILRRMANNGKISEKIIVQ